MTARIRRLRGLLRKNCNARVGGSLIAFLLAATCTSSIAAETAPFSLTSPDFLPDRPIPESHTFNGYGCAGANRSPKLEWQGAPRGTKSFAITMFDLDEQGSPSGWWHWVVYDLPVTASGLPEDAGALNSRTLPTGAVQGRTDMSQDAYHGPCPGKGEPAHRYQITLYALSVAHLPVPSEASGAMVTFTAHDFTLAKAVLTARYGR